MMGNLTKASVARATERGMLNDGDGLYLQISVNGAKSWIFRFRDGGLHFKSGKSLTSYAEEARVKGRI